MTKTFGRLVAAAAATGALALIPLTAVSTTAASAATTSASAVTYDNTSNWAGYYAGRQASSPSTR